MARPLRLEYPGAVYHVTSRGNQGHPIFRDDEHRKEFLEIIAATGRRYNWLCHAYCLMDNHYHLVVETPDGNLSKAMRQVNAVYTQYFNRREQTAGHLFQGRYKAILIQKDSHLLEVIRYVLLNPVRAGLARTAGDFRWSSYRATCQLDDPHPCLTQDWLYSLFDGKSDAAVRKLASFVADGMTGGNPFLQTKGQVALGTDTFWNELKPVVTERMCVKEIPVAQRMLDRPQLSTLFSAGDKHARNGAISVAVERWGYSQKEVADFLGLHYSSVSRILKEKAPVTQHIQQEKPQVATVIETIQPLPAKLQENKEIKDKPAVEKKQKETQSAADQLSLF